MKKVLIIQNVIPHYRIPIFNELSKYADLTVAFSEGEEPAGVHFRCKHISYFTIPYKTGYFKIYKKSILKMARYYDVVICMLDFSFLNLRYICYLPRKNRLLYWGIGVSAGYCDRYDESSKIAKRIFNRINKSDGMVFYSNYPRDKYIAMGADPRKLFVANNTVSVSPIDPQEKDSFIFIGSLYKQKKIEELLSNYLEAYKEDESIFRLVIVGGGEEYNTIRKWIIDKGLNGKISLVGPIIDDNDLAEYFSKAILCFSPDQAGLSVLKAMGNGVPFVTHKDAITGGEIFNISNGENGILLDDFCEIKDIILKASHEPDKYLKMGKKAKEYYEKNRMIKDMVNGFLEAINAET